MTVYVTEHSGANNYRQPVNQQPLAAYSLSSASTAPFPSSGAKYVRVTADAGSLLNLNSTSTGVTLTSTNSFRISANAVGELFSVSTSFRIQAAST